jgi:hypothetical protein
MNPNKDRMPEIMATKTSLTRWYLSTQIYGVTSEKKVALIVTADGNSDLQYNITFQVILIERTDSVLSTTPPQKLLRAQTEI